MKKLNKLGSIKITNDDDQVVFDTSGISPGNLARILLSQVVELLPKISDSEIQAIKDEYYEMF